MWRALCEPGDVARLVLHPDRGARPESAGQARGDGERRDDKAMPVDLGHLVVEIAHELDESRVAHAVGRGEVVGVEKAAPADERVRLWFVGREGKPAASSTRRRTWSPPSPLRGQRNG